MSRLLQVQLCGFGGQGIVLMGVLLGKAAVKDGFWVAGSNSYGVQARGSSCSSEVIISKEQVDFPHILEADLMVAMSQEAYHRFLPSVKTKGLIVHDGLPLKTLSKGLPLHVSIPATQKSLDELKNRQVANVVLLAAMASLTKVISEKTLQQTVREEVPSRFRALNIQALNLGFAMGEAIKKDSLYTPFPLFQSRGVR